MELKVLVFGSELYNTILEIFHDYRDCCQIYLSLKIALYMRLILHYLTLPLHLEFELH